MKRASRWLVPLAIVVIAVVGLGMVVYAVPPMPHPFYGTVTINGNPAPIGTTVKAKVDGVVCGTYTTTVAGEYGNPAQASYLSVAGDLTEGDTINFFINNVDSGETAIFLPGGPPPDYVTELNLTGTGMPTIASWKDAIDNDGVPDTPCDTFSDYNTEHIVYMVGAGFANNHSYKIAYYDGGNDKRATETETSDGSGNLSSQHTFTPVTDVAGTWHVLVYEATGVADPPSTWSASGISDWCETLASDTFQADESAIPEFPTALAAIVALSLCAGVYLWMRRKAAPIGA